MNNLSKYIIVFLLPFVALSCYKDHSALGNKAITELAINFPGITGSVVNVEKNETLSIDPLIGHTGTEKPVTYEWEIDYEVVSTEKQLVFPCTKLGTFNVRLKTTNEDGSAFKSFTLNVNSPYEEGLIVLGQTEQGEGTLAFMRKFTPEEIAAGKEESFVNNIFTLNNPGEKIGKGPTDVLKKQKQILLSSSTEGKIYYLNDKTFELEATVSAPDIPDFKPVAMNIPDGNFRTASILCQNGKLFSLAMLEHLVLSDAKYYQGVTLKTSFGFNLNDCYTYFWNPDESRLLQYSAYYTTNSLDHFQGRDLLTFFLDNTTLYVLTKDKNNPMDVTKTLFSNYVQNLTTKDLDILQEESLNITSEPVLNPLSPMKINSSFKKLLYASDNKVYSWFFTGTDMSSAPFITVDEGVVTSLEQSPDGNTLYVGVYNQAASGLKGSVYVYNMDNGNLIKKYSNISDKPVKLFYKVRS